MKKNQSKSIIILSIFSILLVVFRVFYTQSEFYLFMLWNLFLAIIPYKITNNLKETKSSFLFYLLFPVWLIFLPNAPYIITDLVHLHQGTKMPIWYDFLLIISFSITGMLLFLTSLNSMFLMVKTRFSHKKAWFMSISALFMSSFGIYLGRYLRWNSWDLFHKPQLLLNDVLMRITHPIQHPKTWIITFGFGFFFLISFLGFRSLNKNNNLII